MILPTELITDILLQLPAKSLLRFKIVCKLWYDLIKDPCFVNLHMQRSLATRSNLHFVFKTRTLNLADFDTFDNPIELNYPGKDSKYGGVGIVGSCNGLLCLKSYDFHLPLFIYNPSTQTYKSVPNLAISSPLGSIFKDGFGYDCVSEDYKCVRILGHLIDEWGSIESEVMVYSLKDNVWRMVPSAPYNFDYYDGNDGKNVLLHDTIHWIGAHRRHNDVFLPIVAFDLRKECFSTLALPNLDTTDYIRMIVGILDGCLCLSVSYMNDCQLWVMKEYGVSGSWIRLFSIAKRNGYEELERPLCYSMNAKKLFVHISVYHQLASVDLDTMNITNVKVADISRCTNAHVCVENLLMLESRAKGDQQVNKKSMWWRRIYKR